jgi:NhaP-type Na+/H+ or K+/H+ antiporter
MDEVIVGILMGFALLLLCTLLMRACEQDESSSIIYIIEHGR